MTTQEIAEEYKKLYDSHMDEAQYCKDKGFEESYKRHFKKAKVAKTKMNFFNKLAAKGL